MEKAKILTFSIASMEVKYPHHVFRTWKDGIIQRKYGVSWRTVCIHNSTTCTICGGPNTCPHLKLKTRCVDCKGGSICDHGCLRNNCIPCKGSAICSHGKYKAYCRDCGGSQLCEHGQRYTCKICNGNGICTHGVARSTCKPCKGGSVCIHNSIRSQCIPCKGGSVCIHSKLKHLCKECHGSSICVHDIHKEACKQCGGSKVCECGNYLKRTGGLCNHCNKDFVFSNPKSSKIGCQFIDVLEKDLGVQIQHHHLDRNKKEWVGEEHRPTEWPKKPIDGYYFDSIENKNVAIEFLGDYFHGHPSLWGPNEDECDHHSRPFKNLFHDTETKLAKLKSLNYKVFYVWESEFKALKGLQSVESICREFQDHLYW
jgi:hypothetical protein